MRGRKNKKIINYSLTFTLLILVLFHLIIFTFWYSWEKDGVREEARKHAILSNDLLGLLKGREQTDLDTLLRSGSIKKDISNLTQVSQYSAAYLESLYGDESLTVFGPTPDREDMKVIKDKIYKKWLAKRTDLSENIFIYEEGEPYIGRYIKDPNDRERYLLIIKMRNPHFQQILDLSSGNLSQETFIFDENNNLISRRGNLPEELMTYLTSDRYFEKLSGGDLYIGITNNISQWKTLLIFREIYRGLLLKVFLSTFMITIPLGALIFVFLRGFSHKFYTPFKNIIEFLEERVEGDPNKSLEELLQTKRSYEESLPKLREQFLLNILTRDEQLPERIVERYRFNFRNNRFFIVGILPKDLLLKEEFMEFLKERSDRVDLASGRELVVVFSEDTREELEKIPSEFIPLVEGKVGAFSSIEEDFRSINRAYREAEFCWHSSLRTPFNIITPTLLGEIALDTPDTTLLRKELLAKIREGGEWRQIFQELMEIILSSGQSVMSLKITFIHLLSEILTLDEGGETGQLSEATFFKFEDLNTHSKVKNFFEEVIEDIEEKISAKRRRVDLKTSERIEDYIKEKYPEMDFTISSLAADLGYSISFLEKKFRNTHGVSIKEYLIQTRIYNAKLHLKRDPALRIKELAWMVGYENSRSFINIFKKYTGVTPGEYKKSL